MSKEQATEEAIMMVAPAKKAVVKSLPKKGVAKKTAVKKVPKKAATSATPAAKIKRIFPQYSLEDARQIADVIKKLNAGNPWSPSEIAPAIGVGMGSNFFYLSTSSRDYGFTVGTRDTPVIELTDLGRRLVYPTTPKEESDAVFAAFMNVELFRKVYDYYQGGNLPDITYLKNTLKTVFGVEEKFQDEFYALYQKNLAYITSPKFAEARQQARQSEHVQVSDGHTIILGESGNKGALVAFVAMPFSEKTGKYSAGYFDEVLKHLITPAAVKANFNARTANKAGSEVIQSTIVNELDSADLVIVDLTEHNPNVLFELGMRIAFNKPVCLIRAEGTGPIFDIDHMLRVYSYKPNLWASTLAIDIPGLTAHIAETWKLKDTRSYLDILRKNQPD